MFTKFQISMLFSFKILKNHSLIQETMTSDGKKFVLTYIHRIKSVSNIKRIL